MSRTKKDMQPYWRPDFREPSTLPDIKVVRTDFIVNLVALAILLCVAVFVLQREYRAYSIGSSVSDLESRISAVESDDSRYLKQNKRFLDASRHVVELERFHAAPALPQKVLASLVELQPEGMLLKTISYSETVARRGKSAKWMEYDLDFSGEVLNLNDLTVFKQSLQQSDVLKLDGLKVTVRESNGMRDENGIFPCRVSVVISAEKKKS